MKKYKKILKEIKPDYVLSYNIKPNVYGGMACKNIKTKFMPNITGLGTALEYPGIMQKITITLNKFGLKNADTVFFQNSENMSFFEKNKIFIKVNKKKLTKEGLILLKDLRKNEYKITLKPDYESFRERNYIFKLGKHNISGNSITFNITSKENGNYEIKI